MSQFPLSLNTTQLFSLIPLKQFQIVIVVLQHGESECTGYFLSGTYQLDETTRTRHGSITLHQLSVGSEIGM